MQRQNADESFYISLTISFLLSFLTSILMPQMFYRLELYPNSISMSFDHILISIYILLKNQAIFHLHHIRYCLPVKRQAIFKYPEYLNVLNCSFIAKMYILKYILTFINKFCHKIKYVAISRSLCYFSCDVFFIQA